MRAPRTPATRNEHAEGSSTLLISTTRRQGASARASVLLDHNFDRELWSRPISERCRNIRHQLVHSSHAAESPSSNLRVEATACVALGVSQGYACPACWMMRICTSSPVLAHHGRELAPPHDEPPLPACMDVDSQKTTRKRPLGGDWITGMRLCAPNYADARTTPLAPHGPLPPPPPR